MFCSLNVIHCFSKEGRDFKTLSHIPGVTNLNVTLKWLFIIYIRDYRI